MDPAYRGERDRTELDKREGDPRLVSRRSDRPSDESQKIATCARWISLKASDMSPRGSEDSDLRFANVGIAERARHQTTTRVVVKCASCMFFHAPAHRALLHAWSSMTLSTLLVAASSWMAPWVMTATGLPMPADEPARAAGMVPSLLWRRQDFQGIDRPHLASCAPASARHTRKAKSLHPTCDPVTRPGHGRRRNTTGPPTPIAPVQNGGPAGGRNRAG